MIVNRREVLVAGALIAGAGVAIVGGQGNDMYGLIGKVTAVDGKRDELIAILLDGSANMPGCLSYIVATDSQDRNAIWITEVWRDQASHAASLTLAPVRQAIAKGRPLIAGFGERVETTPVGGQGLR
jgi:quinol monooxygenase YgiN